MELLQSDALVFGLAGVGLVVTAVAILRDEPRADSPLKVTKSVRDWRDLS